MGIDADWVRGLSTQVAARWEQRPPVRRARGAAELAGEVSRDAVQLHAGLPEVEHVARQLERRQLAFLERHADRLADRQAAGRVRVGPRQALCVTGLSNLPSFFRETDARGRSPRDVCEDVACLALDLTMTGRSDLAERLLSAFAGETNDFELYGVVDFYLRQQALSRAARLASPQEPGGATSHVSDTTRAREARRWLILGLSTGHQPLVPPMLVAVGGLVASGKSTIARRIAEHMAAPRIEADRARAYLVGDDPNRAFGAGVGGEVYGELVRRAEIVLGSGRPVVLDACFPLARQRDVARHLALERGWPFLFVECRVDPETARVRLAERDASAPAGGWTQIYADLAKQWQTADELAPEEHLIVDCTRTIADNEAELEVHIPGAPINAGLH